MQGEGTRISGTLIGAVLESTGYHYQGAILDALREPFANEAGGLIYLVAVCLALFLMSTQGGFKMSAWLMVGPPLFFAVTQVRESIPNARWEFSLEARNQPRVEEKVELERPKSQEKEARVSKLFARYVGVTSEVMRHIVETMSRGRSKTDIWFMVKAQLFAQMHTAQIDDPGFSELVHGALFIECGDIVRWAEMVANPAARVDTTGNASSWIARALQAAKEWFFPSRTKAEENFVKHFSEKDVKLGDQGARYVASLVLGNQATQAQIDAKKEEILATTFSCFDIWRFTVEGLLEGAGRKHDAIKREAVAQGIPVSVIQNLMLQVQGYDTNAPLVYDRGAAARIRPEAVDTINRVIALYFLRNEISRPDRGGWISWMAGRHEVRVMPMRLQGESAISERARVSVREWSEKERLIHAAANLPYYQGLVLYFLGALFPFFALLLLIPGKHTGFLLWFALWFWAKSWDLGFAIVMLLDDVLFAIFALEKQEFGKINELPAEIGSALTAVRALDPTFQLSTYYALVSVCVLAIPAISAQIVLGSVTQGAGLVAQGSKLFSDTFAGSALHVSFRDQMAVLRHDASQLMQQRAHAYREMTQKGVALNAVINQRRAEGDIALENDLQFTQQPGSPYLGDLGSDARKRAIAGSAGRVGVLEGIGNPKRLLRKNANALIPTGDSLAAAVTAGLGRLEDGARARNDTELSAAAFGFRAAKSQYDEFQASLGQMHAQATAVGILPLPASDFYGDTFEKDYAFWEQSVNAEFALQHARADTIHSYFHGVAAWFNEKGKKPEGNGEEQKFDIKSLTPDERKDLLKFVQAKMEPTSNPLYKVARWGLAVPAGIYSYSELKERGEKLIKDLGENRLLEKQERPFEPYGQLPSDFYAGEEHLRQQRRELNSGS